MLPVRRGGPGVVMAGALGVVMVGALGVVTVGALDVVMVGGCRGVGLPTAVVGPVMLSVVVPVVLLDAVLVRPDGGLV